MTTRRCLNALFKFYNGKTTSSGPKLWNCIISVNQFSTYYSNKIVDNVDVASNNRNNTLNVALNNADISQRGCAASGNQNTILNNFINSHVEATDEQWEMVMREVIEIKYGLTREQNIEGKIAEICLFNGNLKLLKNFISFLLKKGQRPKSATVCAYMKLCHKCRLECDDNDLKRIQSTARNILSKPSFTLDANMVDSLIIGLSITERWNQCLELLKKEKERASVEAYSAAMMALLDHDQADKAFKILQQMAQLQYTPTPEFFVKWIETFALQPMRQYQLLHYWSWTEHKPEMWVMDRLVPIFQSLPQGHRKRATYTKVSHKGYCEHCKRKMRDVSISEKEFQQLQEAVIENVVVGSDIFNNSSPAEFDRYKRFLKSRGPFDIIIDGLNVAYLAGSQKNSLEKGKLLLDVVRHFKDTNKKVCVIGRHHMHNWSTFQKIHQIADVFLLENLSRDDSFTIYTTLYSGSSAHFVSRDLMRGHKMKLKSDKMNEMLMPLFKRWQLSRQIYINYVRGDGKVFTKDPITFSMTVQQNEDGAWHIPYINDACSVKESYGLHETWLCLSNNVKPFHPK